MGAGYTALGSGVGSLLQDRPDCPSSFRVLPCLHKKLPELDLYPPPCLSQTPPFSHPSPNGHAFQERKRVHQGLSAQMQWPAPQSAGTSLTDMKQNCFMADDSLPRGGCGLTHPGELAAPQRGPLWTLPSAAWGAEGRLPSPQTLPLLPRRASGGLRPEEGRMCRHKPDSSVSSLSLLITSLVQAAGKFLRKNHE